MAVRERRRRKMRSPGSDHRSSVHGGGKSVNGIGVLGGGGGQPQAELPGQRGRRRHVRGVATESRRE